MAEQVIQTDDEVIPHTDDWPLIHRRCADCHSHICERGQSRIGRGEAQNVINENFFFGRSEVLSFNCGVLL